MSLSRSYTNDAANRLTSWNYTVIISSSAFPVQADTYTYDNNGNRLTKQAVLTGQAGTPQNTNYTYDFENRLISLGYTNIPGITGTQTDSLYYNGEGLRTQAIRNNVAATYLYDGANVLVEKDVNNNTTKTYTRGVDFGGGIGSLIAQNTISPAAVGYYDYNDLGSTANLTTSTGTSASSYSYDAYGNLLTAQAGSDTNRYLFSTKEFDSRAGLDYFGARYYDPEIGRWLTPDPLGFGGGQVNLYEYVENNPLNWVDPYGLFIGDVPFKGNPGLPGYSGSGGSGGNGDNTESLSSFKLPPLHITQPPNGRNWGSKEKKLDNFLTDGESNGDIYQSSDNNGGSTEINNRTTDSNDGSTSQVRKEKDADGNTIEVWHEVFDYQGNLIHRDWLGPGPKPPKKPKVN